MPPVRNDGKICKHLAEGSPFGPIEALLSEVRGMVYARAKAQEAGYGLETELAEPESVWAFRDHLTFLDKVIPKRDENAIPTAAIEADATVPIIRITRDFAATPAQLNLSWRPVATPMPNGCSARRMAAWPRMSA